MKTYVIWYYKTRHFITTKTIKTKDLQKWLKSKSRPKYIVEIKEV